MVCFGYKVFFLILNGGFLVQDLLVCFIISWKVYFSHSLCYIIIVAGCSVCGSGCALIGGLGPRVIPDWWIRPQGGLFKVFPFFKKSFFFFFFIF